jgi:hypothetical protein
MAGDWITVCTAYQTNWNIPAQALAGLVSRRAAAEAALDTAKNETTRTPVATAQCKEAFDALIAFMRDFKQRYFLSPPLLDSDLVSLGLRPHDSHPTPSGVPATQVTVETYLVGRHELGLRLIYVDGNPKDKENKGYRIWHSVIALGETPPASPDELRTSFYTQRRKDLIEFGFEDRRRILPCKSRMTARKARGGRCVDTLTKV